MKNTTLNTLRWRRKQDRKILCRWCHIKLYGGNEVCCSDVCREKYNRYMSKYRIRRQKEKHAARSEPIVTIGENRYRVLSKGVIRNKAMSLMSEEELETAKKKMSNKFNAVQNRKEGLVYLKLKRLLNPGEEQVIIKVKKKKVGFFGDPERHAIALKALRESLRKVPRMQKTGTRKRHPWGGRGKLRKNLPIDAEIIIYEDKNEDVQST